MARESSVLMAAGRRVRGHAQRRLTRYPAMTAYQASCECGWISPLCASQPAARAWYTRHLNDMRARANPSPPPDATEKARDV